MNPYPIQWIPLRLAVFCGFLLWGAVGCGDASPARVVVVGIDSADWNLIDPYIEQGKLPNLARIRQGGATANLQVDSPNSPVSWTSIATGKHPEEHGVNVDLKNGPPVLRSDQILVKRLWDITSDYDRRSLVTDYWLTYPAYPIDGVMLSKACPACGAMVDGPDGEYPSGARDVLGEPITTRHQLPDTDRLGLQVNITGLMDGWMQQEEFDLILLPFYPLDTSLHMLWSEHAIGQSGRDLSELDPELAVRIRTGHTVVADILEVADELVGRAFEYAGRDGYVMVVSDHGHTGVPTPARRLTLSRSHFDGESGTTERGTYLVDGATVTLQPTRKYVQMPVEEMSYRYSFPTITVDNDDDGAVWRKLLAIRTDAGDPILREMRGTLVPDLKMKDLASQTLGRHDETNFRLYVNAGFHRIEESGIFGLHGPGVQPGEIDGDVMSVDVTPTLLWLNGIPVGEDMAGRPVTGALKARAAARRPVTFVPTHEDGSKPWASGVTPEVTPEGLERLKALGYIQ